jgi:hypothetical protein
MVERQLKGLCYNCDEKYFLEHTCKEQNIFMAVTKDISEEYVVVPPVEELPPPSDLTPPSDPPDVDPVISLNSLTSFSAPQTLKLIVYIKNRKVIILVDMVAPIILFITALPKKSIVTFVSSIIFK